MGRLSGFSYSQVVRALRQLGFEFHRNAAGSHEIWFSQASRRFTTIPVLFLSPPFAKPLNKSWRLPQTS
ncbi:MAG: type II toxin-antitoxin system HicA family toxin [Holophagales bacterium]|nr:type II toxin-antitoxin system HicA family toxin [Holophagales bacterium]